MSNEYQIETRRRSRSKTPFLRSYCDQENCEHAGVEGHVHHQKKKATVAPNVRTIIEETVEVTSSSSSFPVNTQSTKPVQTKTTQKNKTSDYSSEDPSPENKAKKLLPASAATQQKMSSGTTSTFTSSSSSTVIKKTKNVGGQLIGSSSTPKSNNNLFDNFAAQYMSDFKKTPIRAATDSYGSKETTQNKINAEFERSQLQHSDIQNNSSNRSFGRIFGDSFSAVMGRNRSNPSSIAAATFGSDSQVNKSNNSDHLAYLEYKSAGEYWKRTPKTDYTYSALSPHRRVLAPGIVAMPNMSRRSLDNHDQRVNYMIQREPAKEEFIRRRYEAPLTKRQAEYLSYDSGDEVDYENRKHQQYFNGKNFSSNESWWVRVITTVLTTITSVWTTVSGGAAGNDDSTLYRTHIGEQKRGFFGTIGHGIASAVAAVFRYIYIGISSVLCLDTWLLRSSNPDNRNKKRFLLILLLLLPLLLLAGLYYYLHPNEPFPPRSFSEITFTLPTLPQIDLSEYINQAQYETLKIQATDRLNDLLTWTDDYLLYLRTVSKNLADEGRKLFQREEHFERI